MTGCSAPDCTNAREKGFVMLRFPRDNNFREKWGNATPRPNWTPTSSQSLCEEHFQLEDWQKYKFRLKPEVIPSIFCNCQGTHPQENPAPSSKHSPAALEHSYSAASKLQKNRTFLGDITNLNIHNYSTSRSPLQDASSSNKPKRRTNPIHTPECCIVRNREKTKCLLNTKSSNNVDLELEQAVVGLLQEPVEPVSEENVVDLLQRENEHLQKRVQALEKQLSQVKKEREEVQSEKRKLKKDAEKNMKRLKAVEQEKNELSQFVKGRFSETQVVVAKGGKSQGRKWDEESVKSALRIKCAGGVTALKAASESLMPLSSARTLRQRISPIKFEPGIQHEIIEDFALYLTGRPEHWFDCLLFFDDMAIKPGRQYDKGSDHYIGGVTLPGVTGDACKGQAHLFGGVAKNWKVLAAYHFVSKEANADSNAQVVEEILKKGKEIGLNVLGIVCDMGNRAVMKSLGFKTKKDDIVYRIRNPVDPDKWLYCIPDMIHMYKSTKEMLSNNREIVLSEDVVELYQLPSPKVLVEHIEWLCLYEEEMLVKFDAKLSINDVHCKHFQKMKVVPATHVLSEKTASTLDFLAENGEGSPEFSTTAWFLRLMAKWKKIMTARTRQLALVTIIWMNTTPQ